MESNVLGNIADFEICGPTKNRKIYISWKQNVTFLSNHKNHSLHAKNHNIEKKNSLAYIMSEASSMLQKAFPLVLEIYGIVPAEFK